jgi:hypothetical protein
MLSIIILPDDKHVLRTMLPFIQTDNINVQTNGITTCKGEYNHTASQMLIQDVKDNVTIQT